MALRIALFLAIIFLHSISFADWVRTSGPQGGSIRSVAVGQSATLAVTYQGQVLRDNAGAWMPVGTLLASKLLPVGSSFLATTSSGVSRSTDNGSSWITLFSSSSFSTAMAVDRGIAYVSANDSIFKSTDEGEHWTFIGNEINFTDCMAVLGDTILIGSSVGLGLQRSTNGGASFTTVTNGFAFNSGVVNAIEHVGTEFFISMGQSGMYRSTNGGFSWELRSTGLPQPDATSYSPASRIFTSGTTPYTIVNFGIYRFDGSVWNLLPLDYMVYDIGGAGASLISGTNAGVWRSSNAGSSWDESNTELIATTPGMFARIGGQVFTSIPGRIARTTNNGDTWTFPGHIDASRLVGQGTNLFAATQNGVARSTDSGVTWTNVNAGITQYLADLRDITVAGDAIYASFYFVISFHGTSNWSSGGVFRSTNGGDSWTTVNNGLPFNGFSFVPTHRVAASGQSVFAATVAGVYRTTNGGGSWAPAGDGIPASTWVETLHNSPSHILCGTNRGVFRFNGSSWAEMNTGLPQPNGFYPYAQSFVEHNGTLYVATSVGVFRYDGTSWSPFGTGDPATTSVSNIIEVNGELLAAVSAKGVWKASLATVSVDGNTETPTEFSLAQNYPNPFNPSTTIQFSLSSQEMEGARAQHESLKVFDILGREVATLVNEDMKSGSYSVRFDAGNLTSGIYFYRITSGTFTETKRMLLMK